MLHTSNDIRNPGLRTLPPGVERYFVKGGGLSLIEVLPEDKIEIINDEGRQICEIVVFNSQGKSDLSILNLKENSNADFSKKTISDDEKISVIEKDIYNILETLGMDLNDDSLKGTPRRVAKMFVKELFGGLNPNKLPKSSTFKKKSKLSLLINLATSFEFRITKTELTNFYKNFKKEDSIDYDKFVAILKNKIKTSDEEELKIQNELLENIQCFGIFLNYFLGY